MNQQDQISIRQASIFDVDLLAPLFDAYRQFYRRPSDLELARQFLFARLRNDQSIVFLAVRQDDSAVGFAQLFPSVSSASVARIIILNDLYVQPDVRRQGDGQTAPQGRRTVRPRRRGSAFNAFH